MTQKTRKSPLSTRHRLTARHANRLWHAGWQYREFFGHAFVDDDPDKGCIHGCPGCFFDKVVCEIREEFDGL